MNRHKWIRRSPVLMSAFVLNGCMVLDSYRPVSTYRLEGPREQVPLGEPALGEPSDLPTGGTIDTFSGNDEPIDLGPPVEPPSTFRGGSSSDSNGAANDAIELLRPDGSQQAYFEEITPETSPESMGPSILQPGTTTPLIHIDVSYDEERAVGELATFKLRISNTSNRGLDDLSVFCEFDDGLSFPGAAEKEVRQPLGRIEAASERTLALSLVGEKAGRQCARFIITDGKHDYAEENACIEFVEARASLQMIGPNARTVGSRAEYTIKLDNPTRRELKNVRVSVRYERTLIPREGTEGAARAPGLLEWGFNQLPAGEGVQLQVDFECPTPTERTGIEVTVAADNLRTETQLAWMQVESPNDGIQLRVSDARDLIRVGETTEFLVEIENAGLQVADDLRIESRVPDNFEVLESAIVFRDRKYDVPVEPGTQQVTVSPLRLPASERAFLRITARATRSGDGVFQSRATTAGQTARAESLEPVTVNQLLR